MYSCLHKIKSDPRKRKSSASVSGYISKRKNRNGHCANPKQKNVQTQFLSAPNFLENTFSCVSDLSREDCYVSTQGEARKCKCIRFLANKPSIVRLVALGLKKHFDLDKLNQTLQLANEQRQTDRLTRYCKSL